MIIPVKTSTGSYDIVLEPGALSQVEQHLNLNRKALIVTDSGVPKQYAEIVAVGPGGEVDGKTVEMYVKVGEKVIVGKYAGTEVKLGKEEYTIVRQSDILAVIE